MTDEDLEDLKGALASDDHEEVRTALMVQRSDPSGDPRVLSLIEPLLADETPCLLEIPYLFGETRWLAAHALRAERDALGIEEPVRVSHVPIPLKGADVGWLARAHGLSRPFQPASTVHHERECLAYRELREQGFILRVDLELPMPPTLAEQIRAWLASQG
jgi:hypothetical protein